MKDPLKMPGQKGRESHENGISPAIGIILVAVVVLGVVAAGLVVMSNVVTELEMEKDVQMNVQLSGNDVVLTVFGGDDAASLRIITIYIDGVEGGMFQQERNACIGSPITYTNMASGLTGSKFVMVKGTFADNSIVLLKNTKLMFS